MLLLICQQEKWKFQIKQVNHGKLHFLIQVLDSMTGGRIKKSTKILLEMNLLCLTYGDGVSDVNIEELS